MEGHMKAMDKALDHGMVLILSLSDDPSNNMMFLDTAPDSKREAFTGLCFGNPTDMREDKEGAGAAAKFSHFRYGPIGSTCKTCHQPSTSTSTTVVSSTTATTTGTS